MDPRRVSTTSSSDWAVIMDESQAVPDLDDKIQEYAVKYPFALDNFQKQAIIKLEEGYHVLVAAHTSAGKTVVAEHAIAMAARNGTRAIYTSPTKALSNEKHKAFERIYHDVGLLTGDVQKNQLAPLLVMTTEILRSMLYDQDKRLKDLEVVVMDEMHYMSDVERGHAWEEVVIMLPKNVRLVMLSATLGDPMHFARWVGGIKQRKVFVVSTTKRPVPLKHYLYTGSSCSSEGLYLVVDEDGNFQRPGYEAAFEVLAAWEGGFAELPGCTERTVGQRLSRGAKTNMWCSLLANLKKNNKLPAVIFVFSRNGCEMSARRVSEYTEFTNAAEKKRIGKYIHTCFNEKLTEEERRLPQVVWFRQILKSGVAVHHSAMLPILREIVEVLYQVGLIKVLFATETLAIGVNMPTRTVVFEATSKYDGQSSRPLKSAEYAQMAGRAGRRGLDDTGDVVVVCCEHLPTVQTLEKILVAKPENLQSQFRLTDGMILNLLESRSISMEAMMEQSFRQYNRKEKPKKTYSEKLQLAERHYFESCRTPLASDGEGFELFFNAATEYIDVQNKIMPILLSNPKILKELVPGKLLVVSTGPYINQLGVLLTNKIKLSLGPKQAPYKVFILDTKIDEHMELDNNFYRMLGFSAGYDSIGTKERTSNHTVLDISLDHILAVSKMSLPLDFKVIMDVWERRQQPRFKDSPIGPACTRAVEELSRLSCSVNSGTTTLTYIDLVKSIINPTANIKTYIEKMNKCEEQIKELKKYTEATDFKTEFGKFYKRKLAQLEVEKYRKLAYGHLELYPEYQKRLKFLRELKFIDDWERLTVKGQFARHVGQHSLLITELVCRGLFISIPLSKIPSLLSGFVCEGPSNQNHVILTKSYLDQGHDELEQAVVQAMRLSDEFNKIRSKYSLDSRFEYKVDFSFREVILQWTSQVPFEDIIDFYKMNEGILVKCILQIREILFSLIEGAKDVGDKNLEAIMREAAETIQRDIIYSGSQTVQEEVESMKQLTVNLKQIKSNNEKLTGAKGKRLKKSRKREQLNQMSGAPSEDPDHPLPGGSGTYIKFAYPVYLVTFH